MKAKTFSTASIQLVAISACNWNSETLTSSKSVKMCENSVMNHTCNRRNILKRHTRKEELKQLIMQQYGYTTIAERHCKLDARKWHFSSPLSRDRAVTLRTKLSILYVYVPSAYSWSQNFKMHWEKWLYNQSFLHRSKRRNWNYCQEKLILPRFRQNSKDSIWQLTTSFWLHLGQPMFSPLKHKPHPKKMPFAQIDLHPTITSCW